jgi:hypothetical protein
MYNNRPIIRVLVFFFYFFDFATVRKAKILLELLVFACDWRSSLVERLVNTVSNVLFAVGVVPEFRQT